MIVPPVVVVLVITFSCFSFEISIRRHPMIAVSTTRSTFKIPIITGLPSRIRFVARCQEPRRAARARS